MPHEHWELNATSVPARKNPDCSWTNGTNTLTSTTFPLTAFGAQIRRLYLQRATTHNIVLPAPGASPVRNSLAGYLPSPDSLGEPDLAWVIVKTWNETDIPDSTVFPITFSESAAHSTFYYYRLSLVWSKFGNVQQIGSQWDSNIATIVQPFNLSICQTDLCVIPQGCRTLVWDAPQLGIPIITGIVRTSPTTCCSIPCDGTGCYRVSYAWPYSSNLPVTYWISKSYDGTTFSPYVAQASTSGSWDDSDPAHLIYYRFDAQLASNSIVAGNVFRATY